MQTPSISYYQQAIIEIEQFPVEHMPNLIKVIKLFKDNVVLKNATESFAAAWVDTISGNTFPVDSLWDGIDAK